MSNPSKLMSKVEIRQKRRIRQLEEALRPFAHTPLAPAGADAIWLYSGTRIRDDADLVPEDFTRARTTLGVMRGIS